MNADTRTPAQKSVDSIKLVANVFSFLTAINGVAAHRNPSSVTEVAFVYVAIVVTAGLYMYHGLSGRQINYGDWKWSFALCFGWLFAGTLWLALA